MGMSNRERALGHHKSRGTSVGVGIPTNREGAEGDFALRKTAAGLKLYIKYGDLWYDVNKLTPHSNIGISTFSNTDATPNIRGGTIFNSGTSTETITDFSNGVIGQTITVISKAAITYDVTSTNLKGGSTNIVTASGDYTTWIFDGASWYLISWMDVSENLADGSDGF